MQKKALFLGGSLGGVTSLALMALFYLGEQLAGLPFVPFDLFDWLARVLPGNIITISIDTMVSLVRGLNLGPTDSTAKLIEQLMALGLVAGAGVIFGLIIAAVLRHTPWPAWAVGLGGGLVVYLGVAAVELNLGLPSNPILPLLWLAVVIIGWGLLLAQLLHSINATLGSASPEVRTGRRAALVKIIGGSATVALAGWGLGSLLSRQEEATGAGQPLTNLPESSPPPLPTPAVTSQPAVTAATSDDRIDPAPGTRPEVTPNEDFYRIDINTRPVVIAGESWVLEVEGLFDQPRPLTLPDLMVYPAVTQPITLGCISNLIGGDLISTSNWTGVRLRDLLKDLGLRPEAKALYIEAADGFYESVTMEDMMDPRTLLVYGMNEETLPVEHGFPLRIYIPNRYGMKQPKWISRIEAVDEQGPGYWVERGWSEEARPQVLSIIDTVAEDNAVDGIIPIGGIAWAGDRGIQKIEVRVDEGEWKEATLRVPPLSPLTWVQWRYDWPSSAGTHTFTVRATDGSGMLQIEEERFPHPNGATGYHSVTVDI